MNRVMSRYCGMVRLKPEGRAWETGMAGGVDFIGDWARAHGTSKGVFSAFDPSAPCCVA